MDGGSLDLPRPSKPLRIEFDRLTIGGKLSRGFADERLLPSDRVLRVVVVSGRGSILQGGALPPMVLVPLRRSIRITDSDCTRVLRTGELFIAEAGQCQQVVGSGAALWLALVARPAVWRLLFDTTAAAPIPEPLIVPAMHHADRTLRRAAVRLARAVETDAESALPMTAALRFVTMLGELQDRFEAHIRRCPGRTLSQRRGVFLRLQRVYNWMEASNALDLCVAGFARAANYSPCHFVRTFSMVYGQTPHTVLMEQRLKRAYRLVAETELSITEVARAAGFEDRCAFARSFKKRFGVAASLVRRCGAVSAAA